LNNNATGFKPVTEEPDEEVLKIVDEGENGIDGRNTASGSQMDEIDKKTSNP